MLRNTHNYVVDKQQTSPQSSQTDKWIQSLNVALKTVFASQSASRRNPAQDLTMYDAHLTAKERKLSSALMRVNHTGEVCAQALYTAQALTTQNPQLQKHLEHAAQEEIDHLAWCQDRLNAFQAHPSFLNPLWFAGAFVIGLTAGKLGGDKVSLGFVTETEKQVQAHLSTHLQHLPHKDIASRAVVTQMRTDEAKHAEAAQEAGGIKLPHPIRTTMHFAGKIMTTVAHYI